MTANAITAATGQAITSISQTNGIIEASAGTITVASSDVTNLSGFVDSKVGSLCATLSAKLSNAWEHRLSDANASNPVVLSSDISNLIVKGVTFGGVYGTSAEVTALTAAIPGQVYVLTGDGYNGKEYICTSTDGTDGIGPGHPTIVEVGDEGAIG